MRKLISIIICSFLLLNGCTEKTELALNSQIESEVLAQNFKGISDKNLSKYIEDRLYMNVIEKLDSEKYFVENIEVKYFSKQHLEELMSNSRSNLYFGYSSKELDEAFGGAKYIFDVENNQTVVKELKEIGDNFNKIVENVAIGTGIILVCVTVSIVTAPAIPVVSSMFAASAKGATVLALSTASLDGLIAASVKGIEGGDFDDAMKDGMLAASEGFKWGALVGALTGGASKAISLKGASRNGLTMNQVAKIQMEKKYPIDVIKQFSSMDQYQACLDAGLDSKIVNGKLALVQNVDVNLTDEFGRTNLKRMKQGLAALDKNGKSFELHHLMQKTDSTLAMLTKEQHMQGGNNSLWHVIGKASEVHEKGNDWDKVRAKFWKDLARQLGE